MYIDPTGVAGINNPDSYVDGDPDASYYGPDAEDDPDFSAYLADLEEAR